MREWELNKGGEIGGGSALYWVLKGAGQACCFVAFA